MESVERCHSEPSIRQMQVIVNTCQVFRYMVQRFPIRLAKSCDGFPAKILKGGIDGEMHFLELED